MPTFFFFSKEIENESWEILCWFAVWVGDLWFDYENSKTWMKKYLLKAAWSFNFEKFLIKNQTKVDFEE